nr:ATP-dependent Clp protease ATP-binding subunit [Deltaproteobacteria bacterium]
SPPGYVGYDEGGQLTEKVRRKPYSVVLLDEIEKAHPDVFNILLQVFDDGHLTDGTGKRVDFRNAVLIMTSNIGTSDIVKQSSIGFGKASAVPPYEEIKNRVMAEVKKILRPEFLNRVDEIIVFKMLEIRDVYKIINIIMREVSDRLKEQGLGITLTRGVKDFFARKGFSAETGVRPLRRIIEKYLEDPLAEELLKGKFSQGSQIKVKAARDGLVFTEGVKDAAVDS